MTLRVLDRVWDPDATGNADWWSVASHTVVLLDGAAPEGEDHVSSHENDTVWLVRRFAEQFQKQLDGAAAPLDIAQLAERARLALEREYRELCAQAGAVPAEAPFACLAIAHDAQARIELSNMGDQTSLVRDHRGQIRKLGESTVRELDRRALQLLERERALGVEPHAERRARIRPALLANRALRNQLAGYDVLDLQASCTDRFERLVCDRTDTRDLLMMSDGFYRLVDTFGRYTDTSLFDAVEREGLSALLDELRSLERSDGDCARYPRFKVHDDATAIWIAVDP